MVTRSAPSQKQARSLCLGLKGGRHRRAHDDQPNVMTTTTNRRQHPNKGEAMPLEIVEIGQQVPLSKIGETGSAQKVRKETADQGLDELLKSMKAHGQIHAISVVENGDGTYELANGHRRHAA